MNRKNRKNGAILILVLIIIAAISVIMLSIEENSSKNYGLSEKLYTDNQAAFYFHSAIKVAIRLLKNDTNGYDSQKDDWAKLPPLQLNSYTTIDVKIFPVNEKININNIASKDRYLAKRTTDALKQILLNYNKNPSILINNLKDWINRTKGYDFLYTTYKPIGGYLYSLKEIGFINGFDGLLSKLSKYFTVDGYSGKININLASGDVLKTYLPELTGCIENILKYRKKHPFKNITQIRNLNCISDAEYLKIQPYITTQSDLFAVNINITINGINEHAEALLKRIGSIIKVVKYFEGKGEYE